MTDITLYVFAKLPDTEFSTSNLNGEPATMSKLNQILYKWMLPNSAVQKFRFLLEGFSSGAIDSNDASGDITRNKLVYESADALAHLYSPVFKLNKTHILQEYFIPEKGFEQWMLFLKNVFLEGFGIFVLNRYALLNITIRYVKKDTTTYLPYVNNDMYAFVFYFRIEANKEMDDYLEKIHKILVDYALNLGGSFYLPYRHHYNRSQLMRAYPGIHRFVALKKKYDSSGVFGNRWFDMVKKV